MTHDQLKQIEQQLTQRKAQIQKEIETILKELDEIASYDSIDDIEDLAQLETINENDKSILQRLQNESKQIDQALKRIAQGTYGKCKDGKTIPFEKLQVDPLYEC